eukprot:8008262-Pyramimonas_sp.AAC.1
MSIKLEAHEPGRPGSPHLPVDEKAEGGELPLDLAAHGLNLGAPRASNEVGVHARGASGWQLGREHHATSA